MKKLAECLLRRKELQQKLDRMGPVRNPDLFKMRTERVAVGQGTNMEELRAAVPRVSFAQFDAEYNLYAMQLRKVDAAIQQANWTTELDSIDDCFIDHVYKDEVDE